jgi:hypothetical protein
VVVINDDGSDNSPSSGRSIVINLIIFNQVFTETAAAELIGIEPEDKALKQELWPSETEEIKEDNIEKQEEEEQENNGDTKRRGLEEDIMIDDNYSSDDDVPFELHFDNIVPFPYDLHYYYFL